MDTVAGCKASDWVSEGIEMKDLIPYDFPDVEKMKQQVIKAIFLEDYMKEWSPFNNTRFAVSQGLQGRAAHDPDKTGKLNRFSSLDADLKVVNQMIKYLKFGFGQTTDEVCYAIREGKKVPEHVMTSMYERLYLPSESEGFDRVIEVKHV